MNTKRVGPIVEIRHDVLALLERGCRRVNGKQQRALHHFRITTFRKRPRPGRRHDIRAGAGANDAAQHLRVEERAVGVDPQQPLRVRGSAGLLKARQHVDEISPDDARAASTGKGRDRIVRALDARRHDHRGTDRGFDSRQDVLENERGP